MVNRANLLERILDSHGGQLSDEFARYLLSLHFSDSDHTRCTDLSSKAQDGTLTAAETAELDEYLAASDVLAILQSKARKSLESRTPAA